MTRLPRKKISVPFLWLCWIFDFELFRKQAGLVHWTHQKWGTLLAESLQHPSTQAPPKPPCETALGEKPVAVSFGFGRRGMGHGPRISMAATLGHESHLWVAHNDIRGRNSEILGSLPFPFFSSIVPSKNRSRFPWVSGGFLERRIPGKDGEGTPIIFVMIVNGLWAARTSERSQMLCPVAQWQLPQSVSGIRAPLNMG